MLPRLACRVIGHKRTRVKELPVPEGSPRLFMSSPEGDRTACRRCRSVLKEKK